MTYTHYSILLLCAFLGNMGFMQAQITVDFNADNTSGCGSLQVAFTDQSSSTAGNIVSWAWDLGGVNSSNQNPGRIFGNAGVYTICLTVTDNQNNSSSACKTDYIQVYDLPVPQFAVSQIGGCSPLLVDFIDASTVSNSNITEWIWGLGGSSGVIVDDGSISSISSQYNLPDDYTISLTIKDDNGCSNTITKVDFLTVYPDPEIMVSSSDTFGCELPFEVNFNNQSNLTGTEFTWDFGNGETFVGTQPPTIMYDDYGAYTIQVFAENLSTNCRDTLVLDNFVQVGLPIDHLVFPTSGCEDLTVKFRDFTLIPADSLVWDFGDGQTAKVKNVNHIYEESGCYEVSLTRYVGDCASTAVWPDCILVYEELIATPTSTNPNGCTLPFSIDFTGIATSDAPIIAWSWDFGDQTTSTEQNPNHIYNDFGSYPVQLAIENTNGCIDTIIVDTIQLIETRAMLNFDLIGGCTPYTFTLEENSISSTPITNWSWEILDEMGSSVFTSTLENPTTTLTTVGLYDVVLTVTDGLGCTSSQTFETVIGVGNALSVNFQATPLQACINNGVSFIDQSQGEIDYWIWDFGDGQTIEGVQNPTHEYLDTGFFDVILYGFNNGCVSELIFEDYIYVSPPVGIAKLELDCADPFTASFKNLSVGADSIFWNFGLSDIFTDTSSLMEPSYMYSDTGCYSARFKVFNFESGCTDTDTILVCITDPSAQFSLDQTGGCAPLTVTVNDHSLFAESYLWTVEGGVISDSTAAMPSITFTEPGVYNNIQLVITDIHDCTDTLIYPNPVVVNAVTANINPVPMGGCFPLTVAFEDSSTSLIGTPIQWEWVIGDSLFITDQQNFEYTFDTTGVFEVQLIVMDDQFCRDTIVVTEAVEVTQPVASFVADTISCTVDVIQFTNTSIGTGLTYLWDFGDNTTSDMENPVHNYTQQGSYSVCLTVTDLYACDSTICRQNYIQIANPIASFTVDSSFADCPPLLTQFQNTSTNATSYEWDFGDNSGFSNLEHPPHVYTIPGTYDVTLIAIATEQCRDTLRIEDLVILQGPVGNFTFEIDTSCVPLKVAFTGSSSDIYDYVWDFGNGDLDSTLNVVSDNVDFVYNELGAYVPKLILIDEANCMRAIESQDTIHVVDLQANFMATDSLLCNDNTSISLVNLSFSTAPITFTEWTMEGIDPNTSTVSEPQIMYNDAGVFDVQLIVENGYCRDTLFKPNYIRVGELPTASFDLSDTLGCAPLTVDFTSTASSSVGAITQWQWDFGDSTQSNLSNPQHTFIGGNTYPVELIVQTDIGCLDTVVQEIEVLPFPLIDFAQLASICQGEEVQLSAAISGDTIGSQFYWLPDPTLSCLNCFNPIANPLDTTVYHFVAMSLNGCEDTIEVVVNVLPFAIPIITLTPDTTICANEVVQLQASGGDNIWAYQWDASRSGLSCYNACQNPVAVPTAETVYVLTVTNASGCSAIDSVSVGLIDEFQPIAGEDRTICIGDSVQLQVTSGEQWQWLNPIDLSCTFCEAPFSFPDSSRTYVVKAINDLGCTIQDSVRVNVLALDNIDAGQDQDLCLGDTVRLNGEGDGALTWFPSTSLSAANIAEPIAQPMSTTTYTLTLENDLCILSDSVTIQVITETDIEVFDLIACAGDTLQLDVSGSADQFTWSPPIQISDPTIANPLVWPLETTNYTVVGQLSSCGPDTAELTIMVDELPAVSLAPVFYFVEGRLIQLEAKVSDDRRYRFDWFPADSLSCSECFNPFANPDTSQIYTLLVVDEDTGCEITLTTRLEPLSSCPEDLIYVPNAFSPNEDGFNDEMKVYSSTLDQINVFTIFNRWGEMVFQTSDIEAVWDGEINSRQAPVGVYVYFLEAPCPIDPKMTIFKKGDITLLR